MSPGRRGKGKTLTFERARADNGCVSSERSTTRGPVMRRLRRQDGQALVEFALIAPLFLMLVVGVIQFGVAINFWFDLQRSANEGARWAVVNAYPGCPRTGPQSVCPAPSGVTYVDGTAIPDLLHYDLANERIAAGEDIKPYICFPASGATPAIGDPVTVRMARVFQFNLIVGKVGSITLHASATMRLEQAATAPTPPNTLRYTSDGPC
jgi:hypothetical protein